MDLALRDDEITEIEFNVNNLNTYMDPYRKLYEIHDYKVIKNNEAIHSLKRYFMNSGT